MAKGRFIVFEGGEGTGKSTQITRLADRLRAEGMHVVTTREPGGTPFAETVRTKLLSGVHADSGPEAEAILVNAGRIDHLDAVIRPALAAGDWVLCDRFSDSTLVYQGVTGGGDAAFIADLNARTIGHTAPDLVIVLDLPCDAAMARVADRGNGSQDRWDTGTQAGFEAIRAAFLDIAKRHLATHVVIDGAADVDGVADRIWSTVQSRLAPEAA